MLFEGQEVARLRASGDSSYDSHKRGRFRPDYAYEVADPDGDEEALDIQDAHVPYVYVEPLDELDAATLEKKSASERGANVGACEFNGGPEGASGRHEDEAGDLPEAPVDDEGEEGEVFEEKQGLEFLDEGEEGEVLEETQGVG